MSAPLFSVVIPTYNRRDRLLRVLHLLAEQLPPGDATEVIVADDGSDDGTGDADFFRNAPRGVQLVRCPRGGPGSARNAGAAEASGEFLAFLEDDVVPRADWLAAARRHLLSGEIDVLEGRTVDAAGGGDVRRFEPEQRPAFIPCNLFVRRELFARLGGYDTEFFDGATGLYFREDTELGFRLMDAGARCSIARDVVVEHPAQFTTTGACLRHARRYRFDPLLYRKHPLRFREDIEVKTVAGIRVRRPLHYLSLVHAAAALTTLACGALALWPAAGAAAASLAATTALVRWKYGGTGNPAVFLLLPFTYLRAFATGSVRYRSFGAWL